MKSIKLVPALLSFVALVSTTVYAHHSTRGIYHDDQIKEVTGLVKAWRFINPHPYLTIDVEEDGEIREYDVSFGGAAVVHLQRRGYTDATFSVGETIIVAGHPARAAGVYGLLIEGQVGDPKREDGSPVVQAGGSMF